MTVYKQEIERLHDVLERALSTLDNLIPLGDATIQGFSKAAVYDLKKELKRSKERLASWTSNY